MESNTPAGTQIDYIEIVDQLKIVKTVKENKSLWIK